MSHNNIETRIKRIQKQLDESYDILKHHKETNVSSTVGEPSNVAESPLANANANANTITNICYTGVATETFVDDVFDKIKNCIIELDEEAGPDLVFDKNLKWHRPTRNILKDTAVGTHYRLYKPTKITKGYAEPEHGPKPPKGYRPPPAARFELDPKPEDPFIEIRMVSEPRGKDNKNTLIFSRAILPNTPAIGGDRTEYQTVYSFGLKLSKTEFEAEPGNDPTKPNDPGAKAIANASTLAAERAAAAEEHAREVAAANAARLKGANSNVAGPVSSAAASGNSSAAKAGNNSSVAAAATAASGNNSSATASGNSSAAKSGNNSSVVAAGNNSSVAAAAASGNSSAAVASGNSSAAKSGNNSSTVASRNNSSAAAVGNNYSAAAASGNSSSAAVASTPINRRAQQNRWIRFAEGTQTQANINASPGYVKSQATKINADVAAAAAAKKVQNNLFAARSASAAKAHTPMAFAKESKAPGINRVANSMRRNAERIRAARGQPQATGWWAPSKGRGGTRKLRRANRTRKVKQLRRRQ